MIGLGLGLSAERDVAALLYGITLTDPHTLIVPVISMLGAAVVACLPAVLRAVRIDPTVLLRSE